MNELIEKLKKMPRWAWWAVGGAVGLVIILAGWARRPNAVTAAEPAADPPAPDPGYAPSPPPAPAVEQEPYDDSWLRSALGGLLNRSGMLEVQVAQLRMTQAAIAGQGMGTAPNRASVSMTPTTKTGLAAGVAIDDDGPTAAEQLIAKQQGVEFSDKFTGYSNIGGPAEMPDGVYDPTKDTKRVYDPVFPDRPSLPAPAERVVQPGAPVFDPSVDYVRTAYEKGDISREQLIKNYQNAGRALPNWLQPAGGGGNSAGGGRNLLQ